MKKYCIIGGGPTGLSLAYVLATKGYNITLIEKDSQLGGSWNQDWIEGKYFSENSPRVFMKTPYVSKLLKDIGIKETDLGSVYGPYFTVKMVKFISKHFTLLDWLLFIIHFVIYKIYKNVNSTVQDWLDNTRFSDSAKKAIKIISILICDRPDKTHIINFFGQMGFGGNLQQFKNPNLWHELILKKLEPLSNFKLYLSTSAVSIKEKDNKITNVICLKHYKHFQINCDKLFLCCQSNNIAPLLKKSDPLVRNNWKNFKWIEDWSKSTYYNGFGFQLHFDTIVQFPNDWCWSCGGDWTVIILPVSKWLTTISKDPKVKTVWSCCIVDMDTRSKRIGKTPNECTKNEVIKECLIQINNAYKIPDPYKVTTSLGLYKKNNRWESKNTGWTRSTKGYLPMKGKIPNLFALGSFTEQSYHNIATFGLSVESTVRYLEKWENIKMVEKPSFTLPILIIILIFIFYK